MRENPSTLDTEPGSSKPDFTAGDLGALNGLAERDALALLESSRLSDTLDWLESLPEEAILRRPWLLVARGWAMIYSGQLRELELVLFDAANQAIDADDPARNRLKGHIAAIRAYAISLSSEIASALVFAQAALRLLPADDYPARGLSAMLVAVALRRLGDLEGAEKAIQVVVSIAEISQDQNLLIGALCDWSTIEVDRGHFRASAAACERAILLGESSQPGAGRPLTNLGRAHICLGRFFREWNELDAALSEVRLGLQLCESWGDASHRILGCCQLAWIYRAMRDERSAFSALQQAEKLAVGLPYYYQSIAALKAHLYLSFGKIDPALEWARQARPSAEEGVSFDEWFIDLVVARTLIAQGKPSEGLYLLQGQLPMLEKAGAAYPMVAVLVLQALAWYDQGLEAQALAALGRALRIAEPEKLVRIFIDEGMVISKLLRLAIDLRIRPAYARRLLAALSQETGIPDVISPDLSWSTALTRRELEILSLVSRGYPYPMIADCLDLSINTIKSYTKSLYARLGVSSRAQAVERAQQLGINLYQDGRP
jgi:LuxR family maltose regulon positive regulatory protein